MKKLKFKGASWDSFFLIFVKLLTTLSSIVLTKILSVGLSLNEYGTYSQANIVVSIGTSLLLLGLGDSLNYYYNNKSSQYDKIKRIAFVNTIFAIELTLGIVFSTLVILSRGAVSSYFANETLKELLMIVSIKPMLDNLLYFYQLLYVSTGKAKFIAVRNLILSIAKLVAVYMAVKIFYSINLIFITLILLDIVQLILFKCFFVRDGFWVNPFKGSCKCAVPILAYGIPMGIYALTNMLTREIDKLVIGRMADTEALAIYTNCSKILPFDIVAVSFATVLIPYIMSYITSNERVEALQLFKNYIKIGYYSVWILGVAVLITNEQAIQFLYSSEYLSGKIIFILYIADSMIRFASMHLILTASGRSKLLMAYSIIALILNAILNIIFYQMFGMVGPAIATVIVAFLYAFLVLGKTLEVLNAKWVEILEVKELCFFILGLIITGIVGYSLNIGLLYVNTPSTISMFIIIVFFVLVNFGINYKNIMKIIRSINRLKM